MASDHCTPLADDHPRRFSVERDMSTGLYDVWDAHRFEYVTCDVVRTEALRAVRKAREDAAVGYRTWRNVA